MGTTVPKTLSNTLKYTITHQTRFTFKTQVLPLKHDLHLLAHKIQFVLLDESLAHINGF